MTNKRICDLEITDDIVHIKIVEIDTDKTITEFDATICQFKVNDTIDKLMGQPQRENK